MLEAYSEFQNLGLKFCVYCNDIFYLNQKEKNMSKMNKKRSTTISKNFSTNFLLIFLLTFWLVAILLLINFAWITDRKLSSF